MKWNVTPDGALACAFGEPWEWFHPICEQYSQLLEQDDDEAASRVGPAVPRNDRQDLPRKPQRGAVKR